MIEPTDETAPTDLLYHYTDARAVLNILRTGVFWASEVLFLNDAQEILFGRDYLVQQLQKLAAGLHPNMENADNDPRIVMKSAAQSSIQVLNSLESNPNQSRVFVTCFCENGDLLSQWRSYGLGGYSIGVNPLALQHLSFDEWELPSGLGKDFYKNPVPELHSVRYVHSVDDTLVNTAMLERIIPPDIAASQNRRIAEAQWQSLYELARIKHTAFSQEQESRVIFVVRTGEAFDEKGKEINTTPPVGFRDTPTTIVPYIRLKVADRAEAFVKVIVGPSPYQELRIEALKRVLREFALRDVVVAGSSTAYRG